MQDIKVREEKMQAKRKNTPRREYLKTIVGMRSLGFYKNNNLTSVYPVSERVSQVVSQMEFERIREGLTKHGLDYNFQQTFFENFGLLSTQVSFPSTILYGSCENANFSDQTLNSKNIYLSFVVIRDCENVLYSFSVKERSTNIHNSVMVRDNCDNVFFGRGIIKSFNIFYSSAISNSSNIWFSNNLINCHDCLFCENLENQSYMIKNIQYSKEDFLQKKQEILTQKEQFFGWYTNILSLHGNNIGSENSTGQYNTQCVNIDSGYFNYQINEGRNIMFLGGKEPGDHVRDCFLNTPHESNVYGVCSAGACENLYNSFHITGSNVYYSKYLENCSYCLGCIGLKNQSFCILNKQYTKEERFELTNKIFAQMDADGSLGTFFPGSMNPFYFNDTAAYLIDDSFTKEEVMKEGYLWRDEEISVDIPAGSDIVETQNLASYQGFDADGNRTINPEILKKVIKDEKGNIYRIVKMEYDFLIKYGLPLPEIHWLERIKLGFRFK